MLWIVGIWVDGLIGFSVIKSEKKKKRNDERTNIFATERRGHGKSAARPRGRTPYSTIWLTSALGWAQHRAILYSIESEENSENLIQSGKRNVEFVNKACLSTRLGGPAKFRSTVTRCGAEFSSVETGMAQHSARGWLSTPHGDG